MFCFDYYNQFISYITRRYHILANLQKKYLVNKPSVLTFMGTRNPQTYSKRATRGPIIQ